jgi:hypothetical protein
MKNASTLPPNDLAILLVGDPGSRKTTLALQFPKVYIFDADSNMSAPLNFLKQANPNFANTIYYDRANVDDTGKEIPIPNQYAHMSACLNAAFKNPDIETIVLDSLTSIVDILIAECKRLASRANNLEMRIQDWGTFGGLLKHLVTSLRSSGKISIFTGHNRVEKDESDGRWKYFLNIPGQSSTLLSGLFTDVWNPYPHITGIGSTQKHDWKIRCLPSSDVDHRGIKSSFGFKVVEDYDTILKKIQPLHKP